METEEILDGTAERKDTALPVSFKTLATFGYLGNGFWAVVFMVFFFLIVTDSGVLHYFGLSVENQVLASLIYLGATVFCTLPIFGIVRMTKQNKGGFLLYAVPNAIWVVYCFSLQNPGTIFFGALSLVFIILFGTYLKYMQ